MPIERPCRLNLKWNLKRHRRHATVGLARRGNRRTRASPMILPPTRAPPKRAPPALLPPLAPALLPSLAPAPPPPLAPSHPSPRRVIRDAHARSRARARGSLRARRRDGFGARARFSSSRAARAISPRTRAPSASSETEPRGVRDVLPARQNGAANESNADSSASNPPVDTNASATVGFAAASANDRSAASTSASLRSTNRRIASSIFVESHADPSVMVHSARARASCVARVSNAARAATFANETCHGRYLAWPAGGIHPHRWIGRGRRDGGVERLAKRDGDVHKRAESLPARRPAANVPDVHVAPIVIFPFAPRRVKLELRRQRRRRRLERGRQRRRHVPKFASLARSP